MGGPGRICHIVYVGAVYTDQNSASFHEQGARVSGQVGAGLEVSGGAPARGPTCAYEDGLVLHVESLEDAWPDFEWRRVNKGHIEVRQLFEWD